MNIQKVTDHAFGRYGRILEGYDLTGILKEMKHTPLPEKVIYVPSVEALEALRILLRVSGLQPFRIGLADCRSRSATATGITTS